MKVLLVQKLNYTNLIRFYSEKFSHRSSDEQIKNTVNDVKSVTTLSSNYSNILENYEDKGSKPLHGDVLKLVHHF